jgi:hypothetical protein
MEFRPGGVRGADASGAPPPDLRRPLTTRTGDLLGAIQALLHLNLAYLQVF